MLPPIALSAKTRRLSAEPRTALPSLILAGVIATSQSARCRVGADMRLETVNGGIALVLDPMASSSSLLAETMIVASTRVPVFTLIAWLELP